MSDDEIVALLISAVVTAVCAWKWFAPALMVRSPARPGAVIWLTPLVCAAILFAVLKTLASKDVRDAPAYLLFYMVVGAAWVGAASQFSVIADLHLRDDVIERGNPAAGTAIAGLMVGLTLAFAGGNIGDGPGWWVVLFCAGMSTAVLGVGWWILAQLGLGEKITVERDVRAGFRAAAWLIAPDSSSAAPWPATGFQPTPH